MPASSMSSYVCISDVQSELDDSNTLGMLQVYRRHGSYQLASYNRTRYTCNQYVYALMRTENVCGDDASIFCSIVYRGGVGACGSSIGGGSIDGDAGIYCGGVSCGGVGVSGVYYGGPD